MRNNNNAKNNAKNQANAQAKNQTNANVEFANDFANTNAKNQTNKLAIKMRQIEVSFFLCVNSENGRFT